MRDHSYSVYIMTNRSRTLYVGMTNNLPRRVRQHKEQLNEGSFTSRYKLDRIVWSSTINMCAMRLPERSRSKDGCGYANCN